jgi:hypothetical protein
MLKHMNDSSSQKEMHSIDISPINFFFFFNFIYLFIFLTKEDTTEFNMRRSFGYQQQSYAVQEVQLQQQSYVINQEAWQSKK